MTFLEPPKPLYWRNNTLHLLDQRLLPAEERYLVCSCWEDVAEAIRFMAVRGAPAIGIAAAFGLTLAAQEAAGDNCGLQAMRQRLKKVAAELENTRPTAVNLRWALRRMMTKLDNLASNTAQEIAVEFTREAEAILAEDLADNRILAAHGSKLLPQSVTVLTHCNAGALATGGYGTALGIIYTARAEGKKIHVYAGETRPLLQGARLTVYELCRTGLAVTLVTDSCAGSLMAAGKINLVLVGADRIAANGDAANKIGTYSLAVLARYHEIPFFIAAPRTTIDLETPSGQDIVIEERGKEEITAFCGASLGSPTAEVFNPAFDITPAELITAIITERGVLFRPDREKIAALFS